MRRQAIVSCAAALLATTVATSPRAVRAAGREHDGERHERDRFQHVILISVDGLHQSGVEHFVAAHPDSTLAALLARGVEYTDAHTSTPSDSFPGLMQLVTGGTPSAGGDETFLTLANPGTGEVFRGVAFAPCADRGPRCSR